MSHDTEELFTHAYDLLEDGDLEGALEQARLLLAQDGENPSFWCMEGQIRLALGEVQSAERAFKRAIELAPGHPEPMFNMANYHLVLEEFDEALRMAGQAIEFAEDDEARFNAYLLQGEAQLGHARRLIEEWEAEVLEVDEHGIPQALQRNEAFELPPLPPEIEALLEKGLETTEKALRLDDEAHEVHDLKAQYLHQMGDIKAAIIGWEKAAEIAPYEPVYWHYLGNAYVEAEDYDEAYKAFRELFEIEADSHEGMDFAREEFLHIAKHACQELEAEVHDHLETPVVFHISVEDFPSEDLIEQAPKQYPFDPWIPCIIKPGPDASDAHESVEFVLFQRNVEREVGTDDPEEMLQFIFELLNMLLIQASELIDEEPIEA